MCVSVDMFVHLHLNISYLRKSNGKLGISKMRLRVSGDILKKKK